MAALSWTLLSLVVLCSNGGHVSGVQSAELELEIAGIFPLYICDLSLQFTTERSYFYESLQLMEAMRFAIEEINRNSAFLPGIKLIPSIRFLCYFNRIEPQLEDLIKSHPVAAVVGTVGEFIPDEIYHYIQRSKFPVMSFTTRALQVHKRPYLLCMVPSVQYQIKAIIDLLTHYNWTYVSIVSSPDKTFTSVMEEFKKEAERHEICVATSLVLCYREGYKEDIKKLKRHPKGQVLVLFTDPFHLEHLLIDAHTENVSFTWVVSGSWGLTEAIMETYNKAVGRVISVDIQSYPLLKFNEYFQAKMEANAYNYTDPQVRSLFSDDFSFVSLPEEKNITETKPKKPSPKVQSVVNAVYAIAHALQNMSSSTCPNMSADCVREHNGTFMTFLRKTRFTAPFSPPDVQYTVDFDHNSYGPARYNIFTIQEINGSFQYQQIGSWAEELTLNINHSMWENNMAPESRCRKPCGKNEVRNIVLGNTCCWDCTECKENQIVINETTCKACDLGYWPDKDHDNCSELPVDYIQWGDGLAIGSLCFSGLGILSTIFVGGVLLWNNNTPIVKASGREFCYILLSGVLLLYIMTFTFIARPSVVICGLRRLGLATSFAICYSALLTKTNRITRIFNSAQKGIAPPRYINLASQLSICLALITCQILGLVIWLVVDPAEVIESVSSDKPLVILKCKSGDMKILLSLVYNVLLILLCTVYAFKSRKYPENFNEAKCIGFTMYTTCIIWLSSVPVFFVVANIPKVQVTTLCASISLCGLVILVFVFVPKLYIIFCHPEKNIKSNSIKDRSHTETSHDRTGEVKEDESQE